MLDTACRTAFTAEHDLFRDSVRRFFDRELIPHLTRWEEEGIIDRGFLTKAGQSGRRCTAVSPFACYPDPQ